MHELPFSFNQYRLYVVIRIRNGVARTAVTDFKVDDNLTCTVKQLVPIASASFKPRAHARRKLRFTRIGTQHRAAM